MNRNDIPDLMRAMPVKASVKGGKICSSATMRKMFERLARLRLLMRRMALDWTLSRRQKAITFDARGQSRVSISKERTNDIYLMGIGKEFSPFLSKKLSSFSTY